MQKHNTKKLVVMALLIAIEIILSRFLSISTPIAKIGFAFVPVVIIAMLYGPFYAGAANGAADFIGAVLFPIGSYFPGFTLTAMLTGVIYGLFLYGRPKKIWGITIMVLVITLFLHLGLNTVWLRMLTGKAFMVILPTRIAQAAVMAPVQIAVTVMIANSVHIKKLVNA